MKGRERRRKRGKINKKHFEFEMNSLEVCRIKETSTTVSATVVPPDLSAAVNRAVTRAGA
jgi:hypothetical protein